MKWVEPGRLKTILTLALPIIGAMVSQTVVNLVDTAMVGSLGDAAMAAVGLGSFANFMAQAFILGLGTGVQAMAARRKGEGQEGSMALSLNGGLLLAAVAAVPLSASLFVSTPHLFPLLSRDPVVQTLGSAYLQARLVGMVFVAANFCFRGYWNGISRPRLYLQTLLLIHTSNIAISYVLIFGKLGLPALGSTGAGIGTTAALALGTAYYLLLGVRLARGNGFLRGMPDATMLRGLLRLSVPSGLQQMAFAAGFTVLMWIIGRIGTAEVAAANVLINLTLFALLPGLGLGLAANSLVGQALGRGAADDARRWGWDVVRVGVGLMALLGLPMWVTPRLLLALFLHNPATLELAVSPLRLVGLGIALDGVGMVLLQALLGAGASRTVLVIATALQWLFFLPAAYLIGPVGGAGLLGIWGVQAIYRAAQAALFAWVWQKGRWQAIRV